MRREPSTWRKGAIKVQKGCWASLIGSVKASASPLVWERTCGAADWLKRQSLFLWTEGGGGGGEADTLYTGKHCGCPPDD